MAPKECENHADLTGRIIKLELEVGHMKESLAKVEKTVEWLATKIIFANGGLAVLLWFLARGGGQ